MSGIYIPGMEMPTDCIFCPLFYGEWQMCSLTERGTQLIGRAKDCPLIPVPDHGDLIDRDALAEDGWTLHKQVMRMGGYAIHEMPLKNPNILVIILADKEEDE